VKATIIDREFSVDYERHVCGIHAAAHRKRKANDEARRAEWDEDQRRRERAAETHRAAADWCERLRVEFGVDADPVHGDALLVSTNPEKLYARLVELRDEFPEEWS